MITANYVFFSATAFFIIIYLRWGFTNLPGEKGQMLAAIPSTRESSGLWAGTNITWYGLLTANSLVFSLALFIVLTAGAGMALAAAGAVCVMILGVALPSSKVVARIVEGKENTFTVGGAAFVTTITAPAAIWAYNSAIGGGIGARADYGVTLSALAVAYILGEGMGRLACISFGCCYGAPLHQCAPMMRRIFAGRGFVFTGKMKKIAYASGLDGVEVLPIQAVTSVIYSIAGLAGLWLFLAGRFSHSFILCAMVVHGWRAVSEFFRADYRGARKISTYQWMGLLAAIYPVLLLPLIPASAPSPVDVRVGFALAWKPEIILALIAIWVAYFSYMGRSAVTGSVISFHVRHENV